MKRIFIASVALCVFSDILTYTPSDLKIKKERVPRHELYLF